MDKTIQLVVVAMIAIIAAVVLAFMLQDQTGSFGTFLGNQQQDASCSVTETKYKNCMVDEDAFQGIDNCNAPEVERDCNSDGSDSEENPDPGGG